MTTALKGTAPHCARLRRCLVGDGLCKWELHHTAPGFNGTSWGTAFANGNCTTSRPASTVPRGGRPLQMGAALHSGFDTETVSMASAPRRRQASIPKRYPHDEWLRRRDGVWLRRRNGCYRSRSRTPKWYHGRIRHRNGAWLRSSSGFAVWANPPASHNHKTHVHNTHTGAATVML